MSNNVALKDMNVKDMVDMILHSLDTEQKNLTHLNIMTMGKTGTGKSTLINSVFSEDLATTGIGKPVTREIQSFSKEDFPLTVYDTPGMELGGERSLDELLTSVVKLIEDGVKSMKVEDAIHCIWYCVATPSHRIEEAELKFIRRFFDETTKHNVPVIMVLTQSYSKKDAQAIREVIESERLAVAGIVPVLANDYEIDEDFTMKGYGLENLLYLTDSVIPEAVRKTLAAVQKADLEMKVKQAHGIVAASATAAASAAYIPIPGPDAALLVPMEVAMIAAITKVFNLPITESTITSIVGATLGTSGATIAGKALANVAKCIPAYGTAIGGTISAAIAAAVSSALGETYIAVMVMISKGEMKAEDLDGKEGRERINEIFKQMLKIRRDANGARVDNQED